MRLGFAKNDITPRGGVELCGFGPYLLRQSTAVRDRLWARAMAVETGRDRALLITCDLIGLPLEYARRVRDGLARRLGYPSEAVMVACSHTHSGPATGYCGWGEPDWPYLETLPQRIIKAGLAAAANLREATWRQAEVPCEGLGVNREYDARPELEAALSDDWRPARPELTDTTCQVFCAEAEGRLLGFVSYFGCHPVVCCAANRQIHGDYCGVATNLLEREHPGAVGLFVQGAQGDVNSCVVHQGEAESLLALDVLASRYARAVRRGLAEAKPLPLDQARGVCRELAFSRKPYTLEQLREMLREREDFVHQLDFTDSTVVEKRSVRMETVCLRALRQVIARMEAGQPAAPGTEIQGLRLGPVAILGSGFETFQAIKNEVRAAARSQLPLVASFVNDVAGYAPDKTAAARGGYAADVVPFITGQVAYANIHDELVAALLELERALGF